jgi:hypothetical protein
MHGSGYGQFPFQGPQQAQHPSFNQQAYRPRQNPPGPRPRVEPPKQKEATSKVEDDQRFVHAWEKDGGDVEKLARVTCFNCAKWGHFSTDCKEPKLCFICQTASHVGKECPEWMKPVEGA